MINVKDNSSHKIFIIPLLILKHIDPIICPRAFSLKKFDSPQTGFVKVCVPTIAFPP
jgi:hypothetical protein